MGSCEFVSALHTPTECEDGAILMNIVAESVFMGPIQVCEHNRWHRVCDTRQDAIVACNQLELNSTGNHTLVSRHVWYCVCMCVCVCVWGGGGGGVSRCAVGDYSGRFSELNGGGIEEEVENGTNRTLTDFIGLVFIVSGGGSVASSSQNMVSSATH